MNLNPAANRPLLYLLLGAAGLFLLYQLAPILTPFLLAAGLAYLCDPLVDRLEGRRLPRAAGTVLVLLGLVLVLGLLGLILAPLLQAQAGMLMTQLPRLLEWAQQAALPWLGGQPGIEPGLAGGMDWLKAHAGELSRLSAFLPTLGGSGLAFMAFLANLVLVPVVLFYLLRDWDHLLAGLSGWIPAEIRPRILALAGEIDRVLAEFVRGQLAVIALMALYYSLGLWLVGAEYALAVGVVAGLLVFVPYLGVIVGVLLASLAGLLQHGDWLALWPIWAVFALGQLLEGFVLTPWLVGERVGLHPLAVIFALMAFGQLFGFFGVLLAIPASAALLVGLRHLKRHLDTTA